MQVRPVWQVEFGQQTCCEPPHGSHLVPRLAHPRPGSQPVSQQGCPEAPHAAHMVENGLTGSVTHAAFASVHARAPVQHVWPVAPHATQVPFAQAVPAAEQVAPAQQGWFAPPQATQAPLEQVVPPSAHRSPAQHPWLNLPHVEQVPFVQVPPAAPADVTHAPWLATQVAPAPAQQPPPAQASPTQHGSPAAPHRTQVPPLQRTPGAVHTAPVQQL